MQIVNRMMKLPTINAKENLPMSLTHEIGIKMQQIAIAKLAREELTSKIQSTVDFNDSTSKVK